MQDFVKAVIAYQKQVDALKSEKRIALTRSFSIISKDICSNSCQWMHTPTTKELRHEAKAALILEVHVYIEY